MLTVSSVLHTTSVVLLIGLPLSSAVLAFAAALIAYRTRRAVQEIHVSINSRMDQLLALTSKAAHAAGRLEGLQVDESLTTSSVERETGG